MRIDQDPLSIGHARAQFAVGDVMSDPVAHAAVQLTTEEFLMTTRAGLEPPGALRAAAAEVLTETFEVKS